jgi:SAM-dependent methyltransferase
MDAAHPDRVIALYERHADAWIRSRRTDDTAEGAWLDRFAAALPAGGTVLDLGCGSGEPLARRLRAAGLAVTGVDAAPAMIARCVAAFPDGDWRLADMRGLDLGRTFDGLVAWHSAFHLAPSDQRGLAATYRRHLRVGGLLLFTSDPAAGESPGALEGEPLYHASLSPDEYRALLAAHGFSVLAHVAKDPTAGDATVWLARRNA